MAQHTAGNPHSITRWIAQFWQLIHSIQTAHPVNISAVGMIFMAVVIAVFPVPGAERAVATGSYGGLTFARLTIVLFAGCGFRLLFRYRLSDREMQLCLFPIFFLWLLCLLAALSAMTTNFATAGGALIILVIVSMLMLWGMSFTYSPYRERP